MGSEGMSKQIVGTWINGNEGRETIQYNSETNRVVIPRADSQTIWAQGMFVDEKLIVKTERSGRTYSAELEDVNTLRWNDGDVWRRETPLVGTSPRHKKRPSMLT